MNLRPWYLAVAVPVALSCSGSGARSHPGDLKVMSFTPAGAIDKPETIVIRFDQPVVDEAMVGKPADPATVAVTPAFAWTGFWQDQRTLAIDPTQRLAGSTTYTVALQGELARRTGAFALSFVHRPLAVEGLSGVDPEMISPDGDLPIAFDQPVDGRAVAAHCKLSRDGADVALIAPSPVAATRVAVRPASRLAAGQAYQLTCAGLTGDGGNTPLAHPYELAVTVRPELAVTDFAPGSTADVAADEVHLVVAFSTPVSLDAARKAVTSKPAIANLGQGYLRDDKTYEVVADLETQTDYRIEVAGLVDQFGQKLARPYTATFKTGDARPRLSMERGIYALEASANGYPLWSRNVGKYAIECAAIPKSRLVQVLTTDMNYDAWGGNDDDKPIDWKKLGVSARKTTVANRIKNKWKLDEVVLGKTCGGSARGVFLAEVTSDEITPDPDRGWWSPRRNRVLANVTDMGVLIKTGTASGLVWVTSLSTGRPIGGAKVSVYAPNGKLVHAATTTSDGLIRVPGSAIVKAQASRPAHEDNEYEDWDSYRSQRLIAVVEHGADLAVVDGNWSNGIQLWNFSVAEDRKGGAVKLRGFIQSDRGLYRPGEQVHFKGLAREIAQGKAPRVPANRQVEVEVQDSRGQSVLTTTTKLSGFGGFAFDLPLAESASVGDYYVRAKVAGQVFREKFSVEEFRPATYELRLGARDKRPRPGDKLAFDLEARYLMGAPTVGAKVEWGLRKRAHVVAFPGYDAYTFSADPHRWYWAWRDPDDYGELLGDGDGKTDAQGHLAIEARDPAKQFDGPIDYILTANVTDEADQTMGRSTVVTAHQTSFYLGLHANELVQAVGMPFGVNLVALAPDGKRVGTTAKLTVTRTLDNCLWEDIGSRAYQKCTQDTKQLLARDVTIAAAGSHTERIYPTEPGDYVIKIEAKDDRGNTVAAASELWVIGKGEAFWSGDEGARMTLVASKPTYEVGDTAKLVAQANLVKPTALITIERDGIIDAKVAQLGSPAEGIELRIEEAWAPNVYAGVAMVSGRHGAGDRNRPQFKMGLVELKVATEHKHLDVGVALDKKTVRPGDKVTGKIRVTHAGKPVKAEVAVSAADEGILQLISYATPDPMKTFYASYGLGVDAGTNWNRVARIADPSKGDPDEGGDSGSTLGGQRVRSKFVASAFWAPMLVTDAHGEIAFSFTAPDNLTAFRIMAVAADAGDRFGAGEQRLTINKPLMAAPALPRFLRSGDAASVGIVVHNTGDAGGRAVVTAKADGASLDRTSQVVDVPANGTARVRFAAKASQNAAATFEFGIALGGEQDKVRITVPIDRPRVFDNRLVVEQKLGKGGSWSGTLGVDASVLADESTLTVTVDRTGVGELAPGLRSLVEYPYGCLEQTLSRFVPLVAAKDLAKTLDDPSLQGTKAESFIHAGIAKVIRHQQGDGQFSLWPQSQTYPHLTAYALWGLTLAEQAGEQVPAEVFDNGIRALQKWANTSGQLKPDGDGAVMAMGAYVMAMRGKPDAGLNARLYNLRAGLPKWGQAFLLRALVRAKADRAQIAEVGKLVEANIVVTDGKALVHETAGPDNYHYMNSDIRASAMTLAALLEVDPQNPRIDPLAAGIKAARDKSGNWVSTQETLWSLVALGDYSRRAAGGETTATVTLDGRRISHKKIIGGEVATLRVPLAEARGGKLAIAVDQPAVVTARVREARVDAMTAVANGFTVARSYSIASGAETGAAGAAVTTVKTGDLVTVKLVVTADADREWIALVDPLPAGLEVVNPKLAAGGVAQPARQDDDPWLRSARGYVHWDHTEMRDDRVQWFADKMYRGTYELTYQARATIDGTFLTMPATIEAMYQPDQRARTAKGTLTITN